MHDAPPAGLEAVLSDRGAEVLETAREGTRSYRRVRAGSCELFARSTSADDDRAAFAREVAIRAVVGEALPLRAPRILAFGPGWTLEPRIDGRVPCGAADVAAVVAAAAAIPELVLPETTAAGTREPTLTRYRRRARMLAGGLRFAELARARRVWARLTLPVVPAHGDFHAGNLLLDAEGPWVIDWELAGPQPLGYDLLSLWPTLTEAEDRDLVLDAALRQAGPARRADTLRLRHLLLVRALAAVTGADRGVGGVGPGAGELCKLLKGSELEAAGA